MDKKEEALQDMQSHAIEDAVEAKSEIDWALRDEDYKDRREEAFEDTYQPEQPTPIDY